jgi:hypothetical protein
LSLWFPGWDPFANDCMFILLYVNSVLVLIECGHTSWGGELHGASLPNAVRGPAR